MKSRPESRLAPDGVAEEQRPDDPDEANGEIVVQKDRSQEFAATRYDHDGHQTEQHSHDAQEIQTGKDDAAPAYPFFDHTNGFVHGFGVRSEEKPGPPSILRNS